MRMDRFTERAQEAIARSQELLQKLGHTQLDVEHLLLALLDQPYQAMLDFCEAQDLMCIDLLPILTPYAEAGEQIYYTTDIHLNARGNEVLAEALAAWLDEHPDIFAAGS